MVQNKTNGAATARLVMYSVEFGEIKRLTQDGDWDTITGIVTNAAKKIKAAGADCLLIGANTMHKIADEIQASVNIPLIHIAEETAKVVSTTGVKKVALLGTKYTMQLDFYANKLLDREIEIIIPPKEDIEYINDTIYNEMSKNIFLPERKSSFLRIINELIERGAEGVILGCTEIPILVKQNDVSVAVFDTTQIHTSAAVEFVLK